MIRTKRVYEKAAKSDGTRILVDRLWPRGVSRERAGVAHWVRELAPSDALRKWYRHDPALWNEFKRRYFKELDGRSEALEELRPLLSGDVVTLVFGSKEETLNNACALKEYLQTRGYVGAE